MICWCCIVILCNLCWIMSYLVLKFSNWGQFMLLHFFQNPSKWILITNICQPGSNTHVRASSHQCKAYSVHFIACVTVLLLIIFSFWKYQRKALILLYTDALWIIPTLHHHLLGMASEFSFRKTTILLNLLMTLKIQRDNKIKRIKKEKITSKYSMYARKRIISSSSMRCYILNNYNRRI